jgi:hypothetical protein
VAEPKRYREKSASPFAKSGVSLDLCRAIEKPFGLS